MCTICCEPGKSTIRYASNDKIDEVGTLQARIMWFHTYQDIIRGCDVDVVAPRSTVVPYAPKAIHQTELPY